MAASRKTRSVGRDKARVPVAAAATEPTRDPVLMQAVSSPLSLYDQFGRIGGNLTPQRVSSIISAADGGSIAQFVDLTHESRQKDGHYQSIMQAREIAISQLQWGLALPEDATPDEQKAAEACEASIRACVTFPVMLEHLNGESLQFGFARSEEIWRLGGSSDAPLLRGLMLHGQFKNLSCRRFGFRQSDGKLLFDAEGHGNVDIGGVDLFDAYPPGKFIGIERRVNGDVLIREGLARVLVWAALFRNWSLRDWLTLAELAWKPLRTGRFNKDTVSKEDVADLQTVLENLTSLGWAAVPKSVELEIAWPSGGVTKGNQGNHAEISEFLGQQMSKAVLGGTLTTEAGSRGARSLGEVHERGQTNLRNADATTITPAVQAYVVAPFYGLNYGDSLRQAEFFFHTEDSLDIKTLAETSGILADHGDTRIPVSWLHDQMGIPVAGDGEETLQAESSASNTGDDNENEDGTDDDSGAPEDAAD